MRGPLAAVSDQTFPVASFPYGTQVCEVEVDPETGAVEIVRYAAVDDVGRAVNPMILHGQTHGGIAQGVGQALLENSHYDPETGQLLAASFMDYAMPRADTFRRSNDRAQRGAVADQPARRPLRRRRRHHAGARRRSSTPSSMRLAEFGVRHIEMPATPERVWRAIQAARAGAAN